MNSESSDFEHCSSLPNPNIVATSLNLIQNCISNIAYYKAGWEGKDNERKLILNNNDFWIRINGNFLDMATIEWFKLFLDKNSNNEYGDHHWKSIFIVDHHKWKEAMFISINETEETFESSALKILNYRNKFLAHRDSASNKLYFPQTDIMKSTCFYLFNQLLKNTGRNYSGYQTSIEDYYEMEFEMAKSIILKN